MELLLSFDILMYICGILGQKKKKKKIHPLDHYNYILHWFLDEESVFLYGKFVFCMIWN